MALDHGMTGCGPVAGVDKCCGLVLGLARGRVNHRDWPRFYTVVSQPDSSLTQIEPLAVMGDEFMLAYVGSMVIFSEKTDRSFYVQSSTYPSPYCRAGGGAV